VVKQKLGELREGQVLRLADDSFAVVAAQRGGRLVQLELETEDGEQATLIGVPGARFRLHDETTPRPLRISDGAADR
jgi:hypothetical protein